MKMSTDIEYFVLIYTDINTEEGKQNSYPK